MPRARSRSSVMACLALRWAASTSSRARSRSASVPPGRAAEVLPGQAELHGHRDHLGLRAVVQIPLDPAQPRRGVVHRVGPGLLQFTHPVPQRRPEQPGGQPPIHGVALLQPPRAIEQHGQPRRNQGEGDGQGMHRPGHQQGVRLPPHQPPRQVDHHAVHVQDLPPDRKRQIGEPPQQQVGRDDHGERRERQLEQQVAASPPTSGIGQGRPGPAQGACLRAQRRRRHDLQSQQPAGQVAVDRAELPGPQQDTISSGSPTSIPGETERQPETDGDSGHDEGKAGNREQQSEGRVPDLPRGIPAERRAQQPQRGLPEPDPVTRGAGRARGRCGGSREGAAPPIAGRGGPLVRPAGRSPGLRCP